jgi:hypothetical protein
MIGGFWDSYQGLVIVAVMLTLIAIEIVGVLNGYPHLHG